MIYNKQYNPNRELPICHTRTFYIHGQRNPVDRFRQLPTISIKTMSLLGGTVVTVLLVLLGWSVLINWLLGLRCWTDGAIPQLSMGGGVVWLMWMDSLTQHWNLLLGPRHSCHPSSSHDSYSLNGLLWQICVAIILMFSWPNGCDLMVMLSPPPPPRPLCSLNPTAKGLPVLPMYLALKFLLGTLYST